LLLRAARLRAFVFRFRTLRLAERLFAGVSPPLILERPFFGLRLAVDVSRSSAQRLLYLEGERFMAERFLLRRLVSPGVRIADVGANIGYYLLFWAATAPGATIHCFEPDPDNLVELERNVKANGVQNVRTYPLAVGAENGEASLAPGINSTVRGDGSGSLKVPIRRLDTVLREGIDLLKVDVEGYEGYVLAGARELLAKHRPLLFVEVHPALIQPTHSVPGLVKGLRELYPVVEAYSPVRQASLRDKLVARYSGEAAVTPVPELSELLASCEDGRRSGPFWLVCRSQPG
jgi:FkbM family methyltransferase